MLLDTAPGSPPRLLSYCTNVHPGETVAEITAALEAHAVPLGDRLGRPLALGLRLGETAVRELEIAGRLESFRDFLRREHLVVTTLNVFPQGRFHADVVKEAVYSPDWSTPERFDYTRRAAQVLARLLPPDDRFGTLSTLPLGFRKSTAGREPRCAASLARLVHELAVLEDREGVHILLCLEPEPLCLIETTGELIAFHRDSLLPCAAELPSVGGRSGPEQLYRHVGACLDTCHAAVEYEDPVGALRALRGAGIAVGKIQVSSALVARDPGARPDVVARLREFAEPRFLHQVIARAPDGTCTRFADLPGFIGAVEHGFRPAEARCHFHVPIHLAEIPPLETSREDLLRLLARERAQPSVRHLEVETYTFPLLPGVAPGPAALVADLEQELRFAHRALAASDPNAAADSPIRSGP
jgi:sugar phosphate isomerase/epimerase